MFLVAIRRRRGRIERVAEISTGFVYAASTMGVTGTRASVSRCRRSGLPGPRGDPPAGVSARGFHPQRAAEVARYADGVIVGSAFVRLVLEAKTPAAAVAGCRSPGRGDGRCSPLGTQAKEPKNE